MAAAAPPGRCGYHPVSWQSLVRPAGSMYGSRCVRASRSTLTWPCLQLLPAPAVVMRTPYGKTGEWQSQRARRFSPKAGMRSFSVDVRGRGDSDGIFQPYRHDGPDGAEVLAWVAAQEWCTGDVATYGLSYASRIQWLTALAAPTRAARDGVPGDAQRSVRGAFRRACPPLCGSTGSGSPMAGCRSSGTMSTGWPCTVTVRCSTMDEAAGFVSPSWRAELQHRTLDEWWEPVRYQHRITEVDVPVLHISGWYDDRGDRHASQLHRGGRRRPGRPAATDGPVGPRREHHANAG